jgi:hypothetical protein
MNGGTIHARCEPDFCSQDSVALLLRIFIVCIATALLGFLSQLHSLLPSKRL